MPQETPEKLNLGFTNTAVAGNLVQWLINGSAMYIDLARPTLENVINGNTTFNPSENVYVVGKAHEVFTFQTLYELETHIIRSGNIGSFNKTTPQLHYLTLSIFTVTTSTSWTMPRIRNGPVTSHV